MKLCIGEISAVPKVPKRQDTAPDHQNSVLTALRHAHQSNESQVQHASSLSMEPLTLYLIAKGSAVKSQMTILSQI